MCPNSQNGNEIGRTLLVEGPTPQFLPIDCNSANDSLGYNDYQFVHILPNKKSEIWLPIALFIYTTIIIQGLKNGNKYSRYLMVVDGFKTDIF